MKMQEKSEESLKKTNSFRPKSSVESLSDQFEFVKKRTMTSQHIEMSYNYENSEPMVEHLIPKQSK
jgi:hypothetical protein